MTLSTLDLENKNQKGVWLGEGEVDDGWIKINKKNLATSGSSARSWQKCKIFIHNLTLFRYYIKKIP